MNRRNVIIAELKQFFSVQELVSRRVYDRYSEKAWRFLDTDLLECILIVRRSLGKPITINTWWNEGSYQQRGLRENLSQIVSNKTRAGNLYLSAHTMGKAVDFKVKGYTAEEVRNRIKEMTFPCKIRLEHHKDGEPISWVHLDVIDEPQNPDIYFFDV